MVAPVIFTSNITGEYLLEFLDSYNYYPDIVTYEAGARKTSLQRDFSKFDKKFSVTYIGQNKYEQVKSLYDISGRTVFCVDWTKDFFKNTDTQADIIYSHPSILPKYRGYSAVTEQIMRGVALSGATFYEASNVVDGGSILRCDRFRVDYSDYPEQFIKKYAEKCALFIMDIKDGAEFERKPQAEEESFYLQRKRRKDGIIDFCRDAFSLYNHIRGISRPYFGAFFTHLGKTYTVWRAQTEVWQGDFGFPGLVVQKDEHGLEVACGTGTVILKEIEHEGVVFNFEDIPFNIGDIIG